MAICHNNTRLIMLVTPRRTQRYNEQIATSQRFAALHKSFTHSLISVLNGIASNRRVKVVVKPSAIELNHPIALNHAIATNTTPHSLNATGNARRIK
jgi:hypothetical protein